MPTDDHGDFILRNIGFNNKYLTINPRIGPQVLAFYRNLLNLMLLFNNQKKLKLSPVFKWLDISELKMPKLR